MNEQQTSARRRTLTPENIAKMVAGRRAKVKSLAERFAAKVDRSGGADACHLWTGSLHGDGYGLIWKGDDSKKPRCHRAHRVAWELAGKVLPRWPMVLDHICRRPACVNVAHLRIVSQEDNCGVLARPTPHQINKAKTHCSRGHPLAGANLAIVRDNRGKPRRSCIACYPATWMWCAEQRDSPPGHRTSRTWRGPFRLEAPK